MQVLQTHTKPELPETFIFEASRTFTGSAGLCFSVTLGQKKMGRQKNAPWYLDGARFYDPEIGLWISPDPAREFFSLYSYGPGNPISGTDTDGREWDISDGDKFEQAQFLLARQYLTSNSSYAKQIFEFYDEPGNDITIYFSNKFPKMLGESPNTASIGTITWNPNFGLVIDANAGTYQSPAFGLIHEILHQWVIATGEISTKGDRSNEEIESIISPHEVKVGLELNQGIIKKEPLRLNYSDNAGYGVKTNVTASNPE